MNPNETDHKAAEATLESWKEIAAYLQRNAVTVRRWEKEEGLPVHRHSHKSGRSVYAYPSEIDAWRATRRVAAEPPPSRPLWNSLLAPPRSLTFGATILLCLIMVGNGVRPQAASAQQARKGVTVRQVWDGAAQVSSVSADGRHLAFAGQGDITIRDLMTGTNRLVTGTKSAGPGEFVAGASISPDGKQVAYTHVLDFTRKAEIRVVPFGGGQSKTVYRVESPGWLAAVSWTPDGKRLLVQRAFADNTSQIAMLTIEDGAYRALKSFGWMGAGTARLSPDGRFVAFSAPASDNVPAHDIFVLATDGSRETRVVEGPAIDWSPVWSPDGSQLIFLSDRTGSAGLWSVPLEQGTATGPAQLLKPDAGVITPAAMTRDGALYYLSESSGRTNVFTVELDRDLNAVKEPQLTSDRFQNISAGASYSPDGRYLAYYSLAPNAQMIGLTRLIIRTLSSGQERDIRMPRLAIPPYPYLTPPKWFPDGRSVLVASWGPQKPAIGFHRVDVATGAAELVHQANGVNAIIQGQYDLTGDGKSLFYVEGAAGARSVMMRFDFATKQAVEVRTGFFRYLAVSPDGKQVAFSGDPDGAGKQAIKVAPAAGGEARIAYTQPEASFVPLTWSSDQRFLILSRPEPGGLWKVPAEGGQAEKMGISVAGNIFSPQSFGNQVSFTTRDRAAVGVWALENFLPKNDR